MASKNGLSHPTIAFKPCDLASPFLYLSCPSPPPGLCSNLGWMNALS